MMSVDPTLLKCVGALGLLYGGLALRMSFYRMAGSPGEGKPDSPLTNMSELQLLTAEWVGAVAPLIIAAGLKDDGPLTPYVGTAAIVFTVSRYTFVSKLLAPKALKYPIGFTSMNASYLSTFLLAASLLI